MARSKNDVTSTTALVAGSQAPVATLDPEIARLVSPDNLRGYYESGASSAQRTPRQAPMSDEEWDALMEDGGGLNITAAGSSVIVPEWLKNGNIVTAGALSQKQIEDISKIGGKLRQLFASSAELRWITPRNGHIGHSHVVLYHSDAQGHPCGDDEVVEMEPAEAYRMLGTLVTGGSWDAEHIMQPCSWVAKAINLRTKTPIGHTFLKDVSTVTDVYGKQHTLGVKRFFMSRQTFGQLCEPFRDGSFAQTIVDTKLNGRMPQSSAEAAWLLAQVIHRRASSSRNPESRANAALYATGGSGLGVTGAIAPETAAARFLFASDGLQQFLAYRQQMRESQRVIAESGYQFPSRQQSVTQYSDDQYQPIQ